MISENTRKWVNGENVEPDPTNKQATPNTFLQNSRCECGARFITDETMRIHALHGNCGKYTVQFQQNDGTWR